MAPQRGGSDAEPLLVGVTNVSGGFLLRQRVRLRKGFDYITSTAKGWHKSYYVTVEEAAAAASSFRRWVRDSGYDVGGDSNALGPSFANLGLRSEAARRLLAKKARAERRERVDVLRRRRDSQQR